LEILVQSEEAKNRVDINKKKEMFIKEVEARVLFLPLPLTCGVMFFSLLHIQLERTHDAKRKGKNRARRGARRR